MTGPVSATRPPVELVREAAISHGVCVRPIVRKVTDTQTGQVELIPIPCGSTLTGDCPPCADKNRRLRIQQCREGWHLTEEPSDPEPDNTDTDAEPDELDDADDAEPEPERRVRSTRRRDDVPDLPRLPVAATTLGRTYTGTDGKTWRPSMFLTLTLPSYGRVRPDGTPLHPGSYDYRRAALDAMHLSKLWDRLVQNLRRAVGYQVQYFAVLEPQRRLAPHLHVAIRGAIPRKLLRQVIAATYASLWWPPHDQPVYTDDRLPVFDHTTGGYVDPDTNRPLPTWDQALDDLDADPHAAPAHVIRFGTQADMQGLIAGTPDTDRRIGYLTKYLTKALDEAIGTDPDHEDEHQDGQPDRTLRATMARRRTHIDRLHHEVKQLPCSPRCANWLRYGIQPDQPTDAMTPGACGAKAHHRDRLGCGGRRVLVSRKWTGKTLTDHRADRANAVRTVLEAAGVAMDDHDTYSATATDHDGKPRYLWDTLDPEQANLDYARVINTAVQRRKRWRTQYEHARQQLDRDPSGPNFHSTNSDNSATHRAA